MVSALFGIQPTPPMHTATSTRADASDGSVQFESVGTDMGSVHPVAILAARVGDARSDVAPTPIPEG
ncbi:hypothetical protein N1027_15155 [Herbiconiux sp. CPCC 205763]|uniref:Uncharacterized protein n=1 Tax=Herbiconiux aconitum TaxID=2970913 RepID=A0ABT2GTC9_9MICO|nr:hypothetical protein [Herbiconiux aconitum]MCS5719474.1 hypothetical protein [Herbiconiux aconitum]